MMKLYEQERKISNLLTNSLSVRESSNFAESIFINSFISKFKSLGFNSLNNLCRVNSFPSANSSFNLPDDSRSIQY